MNPHKVPKYQAFVLNGTLWRDEGPARGTLCRYENVPIHTNTRQKEEEKLLHLLWKHLRRKASGSQFYSAWLF